MTEWGRAIVALGAIFGIVGCLIKVFDPGQKMGGFALRWGLASIAVGAAILCLGDS